MKFSAVSILSLASVAIAIAQPQITGGPVVVKRQSTASIPPPPAESTGCELHIDHYHCEGPAAAVGGASGTTSVPAPPAESTGCVLHGDHYDCEGTATGHDASESHDDHDDHASESHAEHDHDHTSGTLAAATGSIPPPPAESTGCVLHNDHYDCEGPASRTGMGSSMTSAPAVSASSTRSAVASSAAAASSAASSAAASA